MTVKRRSDGVPVRPKPTEEEKREQARLRKERQRAKEKNEDETRWCTAKLRRLELERVAKSRGRYKSKHLARVLNEPPEVPGFKEVNLENMKYLLKDLFAPSPAFPVLYIPDPNTFMRSGRKGAWLPKWKPMAKMMNTCHIFFEHLIASDMEVEIFVPSQPEPFGMTTAGGRPKMQCMKILELCQKISRSCDMSELPNSGLDEFLNYFPYRLLGFTWDVFIDWQAEVIVEKRLEESTPAIVLQTLDECEESDIETIWNRDDMTGYESGCETHERLEYPSLKPQEFLRRLRESAEGYFDRRVSERQNLDTMHPPPSDEVLRGHLYSRESTLSDVDTGNGMIKL